MQHSKSNSGDILRQLVTLAAVIIAFVVNVLSNIFPLNGLTIGGISNTLFKNVLIIPANYAFAIWGLIYLGLFAFAIYQVLPSQRDNPNLRKTGYLLTIASVAQSIWVYLFLSRLFVASVIAMLLILVPLIVMYLRLGIGTTPASRAEKWFIRYPTSIYLGWISVATIVNIASALYINNWNGFGIPAETWTLIMVIIATFVANIALLQRQDIAYSGVSVWALIAIAIKHWDNSTLKIVALSGTLLIIAIGLFKGQGSKVKG
ncbi:tryptophan-rich sensory protein [Rivularia sp. UHCC 0363]|uniref:tryptophan-rich sensory protein n=1 Tax=Rivularia sp. UHCC 0363 TaxID=3110244 RepID=UPI002B20DD9E|nr:tryptophan-rich sensory protein [Rivularia sp. UHCC 0363]MEA5593519.1 tryptophan-rich sensory protein [Rivularia sp. UHCC 0363]